MMMPAILCDTPMPITTPRLVIRSPQNGDGCLLNAAVIESFAELTLWMPWADHIPTIDESEIVVRTMQARWILREELSMLIFEKESGALLGASGFHSINWTLPKFEIGYWVRTSVACKGIITESTNALTQYAINQLGAVRVEIKCDENNIPSKRVAEKLNFHCEGILINNERKPISGQLRNTVVYARQDCLNLPTLDVIW